MLKINLIAAAVASLVLIFITDAFAQRTLVKRNRTPQRQAAKINPNKSTKKPAGYIGETEKNITARVRTRKASNRKKVKKNENIEVEHDETHRTKIRRP